MSSHNQRMEYGRMLVELGAEKPDIVVLEADLGKSTMSCLFEEKYPERYFEMGIAEQNMTSFAGGLALAGKLPFVNTFAVFAAGRAYDQIRQGIATAGLHVIIVGSSSGLSDFGDGATHQAIDDAAIMCAIPNLTVFTPCDGIEVRKAVLAAVNTAGPCYIRLCRNDLDDIFPEDIEYAIGKPVELRSGTDAVIFTQGIMAHQALKTAQMAEIDGVSVAVVHIPTLKPLDEAAVRGLTKGKKAVIVCEEANLKGGLNMLISYILRGSSLPIGSIAINDVFGQSAGSYEELIHYYGLDEGTIYEKLKETLNK